MIGSLLVRGLAAGLIAGVLAGLFGLTFGEPALERALSSGHAHAEAGQSHEEEDVFGRGAQRAGLVIGTTLYGAAAGGIFGLVSAFLSGRTESGAWIRSLALAGGVFLGAVLVPFLKYPPSPPGGAATIDQTPAYLALVALSLLAVFFAWRVSRRVAKSSASARHLSVVGFLLVSFVALYALLPASIPAGGVEAGVLWQFRLSSLGTQAVLWGALGCVFGLLCERLEDAERGDAGPVPSGGAKT